MVQTPQTVLTRSFRHCFTGAGAQTVEVKFADLSFTPTTQVKVNKSSKFSVVDTKSGMSHLLHLISESREFLRKCCNPMIFFS